MELMYLYLALGAVAAIGIVYNLIAMQREERLNRTGL